MYLFIVPNIGIIHFSCPKCKTIPNAFPDHSYWDNFSNLAYSQFWPNNSEHCKKQTNALGWTKFQSTHHHGIRN